MADVMDHGDQQFFDALTALHAQLEVHCEAGEAAVVAGQILGNDGQEYMIQIADPCESKAAVHRAIERQKSKMEIEQ
ncbi:MAG: hypothetical protein ABJL67_24460 [Sulfitobacter sp.]